MSGSTFFAGANSTAQAMGNLTVTNTATATLAAPGVAIGYAAAVAEAQDAAPAAPHTSVTTDSMAVGGTTTSAHAVQWSVDFLMGPTPVSVDVSATSISTHGGSDFLSDYPMAGLTGPSVHGLF